MPDKTIEWQPLVGEGDKTHGIIPAGLIVRAGVEAASELFGAGVSSC